MFRKASRGGLVGVIAALGVLVLSTPAHADYGHSDIAYTSCSWPKGVSDVNITVSQGGYPTTSPRAEDNDARQSWNEMIAQAVRQWDFEARVVTQNDAADGSLSLSYRGQQTDGNPNDANFPTMIYFQNTEKVEGNHLGYTYVYTKSLGGQSGNPDGKANCFIQSAYHQKLQTRIIVKSLIRTQDEKYWFTQFGLDSQGRDVRSSWESCTTSTPVYNKGGYTCGKFYDAGAIMSHELGHAMGVTHPNEPGVGLPSKVQEAGNCNRQRISSNKEDAVATMCRDMLFKRSDQRTLAHWDQVAWKYQWALAYT